MGVKRSILPIVVLTIIWFGVALGKVNENRTRLIKSIMLSVASLSDKISHLPGNKRIHALNIIKNDLVNTLGTSESAHINSLMKEFISKTGAKEIIDKKHKEKKTKIRTKLRNRDYATKYKLVRKLSNKIGNLTDKYLKTAKMRQVTKGVFKKISDRLLKTTAELNYGKFKNYEDIMQLALNVSQYKLFYNDSLKPNNDVQTVINLDQIDDFKRILLNASEVIDTDCIELDKICTDVKKLPKFSCGGKSVNIEKNINFTSGTNTNCSLDVVLLDKIQQAKNIMKELESNYKCLFRSKKNFEAEKIKIKMILLRSTLGSYKNLAVKRTDLNNTVSHPLIYNAAVILKSLSLAIKASLCRDTRRNLVNAAVENSSKFSPKDCKCKDEICADHCNVFCNRTCWQKHNLNLYDCLTGEGNSYTSLDNLCDGKYDCLNGSDEAQCPTGETHYKFEAFPIFKSVLGILSKKLWSSDFKNVQSKLTTLISSIKEIEKTVSKSKVEAEEVKYLRNNAFSMIKTIYSDLMPTSSYDQLDATFTTLFQLKFLLIKALKLSHTGNNSTSSSKSCLCNNGVCILTKCATTCKLSCKAEPVILRFACNIMNISYAIDDVCDGKNDCPDGDDEWGCSKEFCRAHHIVMLRKRLESMVPSKHKNSIARETVENWKSKIITDLKKENDDSSERPTHKAMKETVKSLLQDLVDTYGTLHEFKSLTTDIVLKDFSDISKTIQLSLKSCGI